MRASLEQKRKFGKIVLYIAFLFLFLEVGLRLIFSIPQFQDMLFVNEAYSWQRQWVARHRDLGSEVYYSFDRYHPTLGWSSAPDVRALSVFDGKILNTNSQGFRGVDEFTFERNPGKTRILLLGDSFTFGDEVSDDETYAHFLRKLLPNAEIINMGVHGYGHDQMLLLFLEQGIRYRPDIVVLGYIHADLERNVLSFRDFAKPVFRLGGDELVLENSPVPSPEDVIRWDWLRPRFMDAAAIITEGAAIRSGERAQFEQQVTIRIFDQLVEAVSYAGAMPVFAYLPFGEEITSLAPVTTGEQFFFDYCSTNAAVVCFSTRRIFTERLAQGIVYQTAFHWAAPGHQAVADAIFSFLVLEKGLVQQ